MLLADFLQFQTCYNCIGRYLERLLARNCADDADKATRIADISRSGAEMDSPVRYARSGDVSSRTAFLAQGPSDISADDRVTLSHVELLWEVPAMSIF